MAEAKRGRVSHTTYVEIIGHALVRAGTYLNTCEALTQFELVSSLAETYPMRFASKGYAVRFLLDRAISQVVKVMRAAGDSESLRIATFLELRKQEKSVAAIAREWGLIPSSVIYYRNEQENDHPPHMTVDE